MSEMPRYRILYRDANNENRFRDVESNSLAHAVWELAQASPGSSLVDTLRLPKDNTHYVMHVELNPNWDND